MLSMGEENKIGEFIDPYPFNRFQTVESIMTLLISVTPERVPLLTRK
jgi:hypothetical protein